MQSLLVLALLLALTTSARAANGASALANVPAGVQVRLTLEGRPGTVSGSFVQASSDSLRVLPRGGGQELAVPIASVGSFAFVDDVRPSPRLSTLLGIGLGAAGGAALGVLAGNGLGEGGGGGGGGGEGGGDGGIASARLASAAASAPASKTSADYRAVVGAIAGGLAGGLLGALTSLGMKEAHWTTVTLPERSSSWTPAPAVPAVFAVRFPLPHRTRH